MTNNKNKKAFQSKANRLLFNRFEGVSLYGEVTVNKFEHFWRKGLCMVMRGRLGPGRSISEQD